MPRGLRDRLALAAALGGLPAVVVALGLLLTGRGPEHLRWPLGLLVLLAWLGGIASVRRRIGFRLLTLSNLLAALREGDFSFRLRGARRGNPDGEVAWEMNALADELRASRHGDVEGAALMRRVMGEIDAAVLAFDPRGRLSQVNRAGERLLGKPEAELLGRPAAALGLAACLEGEPARTLTLRLPEAEGRWEMRRGKLRQMGRPHDLVLLSDVSRALRAEEVEAWKRLIRVLGHELGNSLGPIQSVAGTLERLLAREPLPEDWREDAGEGLRVIGARAASLGRFTQAYASLAKLPPPSREPTEIAPLVHRVAALETRVPVAVEPGPALTLRLDRDQIEQALINLLRNAAEASRETGGGATLGWSLRRDALEILVRDEGPGLPETANLFVPFYTTKPDGSGIGLFLARQIAESHGGELLLEDRADRPGCLARLRLPLEGAPGR